MSRAGRIVLSGIGMIVVAVVVIVLLPAPDPLADADTIFIRFAGAEDPGNTEPAEQGLGIVLGEKNLTIVSDPAAADVLLEVQDVRVNLGDIEFALSEGRLEGRLAAECLVTDMISGRKYTMDLSVRFDSQGIAAELVARKFWMFWK